MFARCNQLFSRLCTRRKSAVQRKLRPQVRLESLENRLVPAVFNVNSLADILTPPGGVVTLRSAIQAANATTISHLRC